jgi:hypothetical protein
MEGWKEEQWSGGGGGKAGRLALLLVQAIGMLWSLLRLLWTDANIGCGMHDVLSYSCGRVQGGSIWGVAGDAMCGKKKVGQGGGDKGEDFMMTAL